MRFWLFLFETPPRSSTVLSFLQRPSKRSYLNRSHQTLGVIDLYLCPTDPNNNIPYSYQPLSWIRLHRSIWSFHDRYPIWDQFRALTCHSAGMFDQKLTGFILSKMIAYFFIVCLRTCRSLIFTSLTRLPLVLHFSIVCFYRVSSAGPPCLRGLDHGDPLDGA
jgi:hypothetical protein